MSVIHDYRADHADHSEQHIGNYRLRHLLDQREFSAIYLGEHQEQRTQVAIKLLDEQRIGGDLVKFFARASMLSRLHHPHMIQLLDFGMAGNKAYLVMDYAPNGTLRQRHPRGSIVPPQTVVQYVSQVADALEYIHQHNFIHCDIKPHNMLLGSDNEVMVSDFGIAIISYNPAQQQSYQHDFEGTVIYAAPEQLQGYPRRSSDQYSLGVVAYEWLCGQWPFSGTFDDIARGHLSSSPPPLRTKNPTLSPTIEQVVMKTLAKKPEARFASVAEFAQALQWAVSPSHDKTNEPAAAPTQPTLKRQFISPQPFTLKTLPQ